MKELTPAQYGRVACAINDYALYGIEPTGLKKIENIIFIMAKPSIDSNVAARRNGKSGGAPAGNENAKTKTGTPNNDETSENKGGCFEETTKEKEKDKEKEN
jgi:hypothetical protein